MSIPASYIVDVSPRVISAGAAGIVMNGLFLTTNPQLPVGIVKEFVFATDVADYFGYESQEYYAAVIYFAGYVNSFKKPASIRYARRINANVSAFLRGAEYQGTLQALQAISDGSLNITINNELIELTNIDLASASSFSAAALKIQSAINTLKSTVSAVITYNSISNAFEISTTAAGAQSSVSFAATASSGTDLGSILNLTSSAGAVISPGLDEQTAAENMTQIAAYDSNFVTFTHLYDADADECIALGQWSNSQGVSYCFLPWSNEAAAILDSSTDDIASKMVAAGVTNFTAIYNDYRLAAGVMGAFASIDWTRTNGAIDIAFKQVDGLAPTVTSAADAAVLDKKFYTYYGQFATKNTDFNFIYKGLIVGDYVNLSTYINAIWFNSSIVNAVLNGFAGVGKIAYNDAGYTLIRAWLADPINQAKNVGIIQVGVTLSEAQKAQIISEVGSDITAELYSNGYYLLVADPGATARVTGDSPIVTLYYTDGGVVKKLQISSSVIL
ncbi:MAG: DUF3383 domain-containing protein [Candidatus Mucispirillum faecigallinarum]|nr:DUF3383 domain-containing protein [Candidatus Mucispirillum faecigallinarum]